MVLEKKNQVFYFYNSFSYIFFQKKEKSAEGGIFTAPTGLQALI
jgi:hypothetical protein